MLVQVQPNPLLNRKKAEWMERNKEHQELTFKLNQARQEKDVAQQQSLIFEGKINHTEQKRSELQKELARLQESQKEMNKKVQDLQAQDDFLQSQRQQLQKNLAQTNDKLSRTTRELAQRNGNLERLKQEKENLQKEKLDLQQQLQQIKANIAQIKNRIRDVIRQIKQAEQQRNRLQAEINYINEDINEKKRAIQQAEAMIKKLSEAVKQIEAKKQKLQNQLHEIQAKIRAIQVSINLKREKAEEIRIQQKQAQKRYQERYDEMMKLEGQRKKSLTQLIKSQTKLNELLATQGQLNSKKQQLQIELEVQKKQVVEISSQLDGLNKLEIEVTAKIAQAKTKIQSLFGQINTKEAQIKNLEKAISDENNKITQLRKRANLLVQEERQLSDQYFSSQNTQSQLLNSTKVMEDQVKDQTTAKQNAQQQMKKAELEKAEQQRLRQQQQKQLQEKQKYIRDLQAEIQTLEEQILDVENLQNALFNRIMEPLKGNRHASKKTQLKGKLRKMQNDLCTAKSKKISIQTNIWETNNKIKRIKEDIKDWESTITRSTKKIKNLNGQITTKNNQLVSERNRGQGLKQHMDEKLRSITDTQHEINTSTKIVLQKKAKISGEISGLGQIKKKFLAEMTEMRRLQSDSEKNKAAIDKTNKKFKKNSKQMKKIQANLQKSTKQLEQVNKKVDKTSSIFNKSKEMFSNSDKQYTAVRKDCLEAAAFKQNLNKTKQQLEMELNSTIGMRDRLGVDMQKVSQHLQLKQTELKTKNSQAQSHRRQQKQLQRSLNDKSRVLTEINTTIDEKNQEKLKLINQETSFGHKNRAVFGDVEQKKATITQHTRKMQQQNKHIQAKNGLEREQKSQQQNQKREIKGIISGLDRVRKNKAQANQRKAPVDKALSDKRKEITNNLQDQKSYKAEKEKYEKEKVQAVGTLDGYKRQIGEKEKVIKNLEEYIRSSDRNNVRSQQRQREVVIQNRC